MNPSIHVFLPTPEGYVPLEEATAEQKEAQGAKILRALGRVLMEVQDEATDR